MSGLIVGLVLRTPITEEFNSDAKFIATVYADHAWEDGTHAHPAVDTVAKITGIHVRTVQRYCRRLESIGMLVLSGKGPRGTNQYSFPLESREDGSVRLKLLGGGAVPPRQPAGGGAKSGGAESGGAIVSPKQTTRPLIHEEEKAASKFNFSTELQSELKELGVFVSLWKGIELKLTMDDWTEGDVVALIDWMTDTRASKTKAAQGVVTRMRENTKAPKEYYAFSKRRMSGKWYPGHQANDQANESEQEDQPEDVEPEYVFFQADETVTAEIEQAWRSTLDQLKMDMPRSAFGTWVEDTMPVRFEANTLYIGTISPSARDWLESRLQSTVERLLVGILNREVTVQFVVAAETEVV
jgi:hypothetical protein